MTPGTEEAARKAKDQQSASGSSGRSSREQPLLSEWERPKAPLKHGVPLDPKSSSLADATGTQLA
jgi:hypothetical protein